MYPAVSQVYPGVTQLYLGCSLPQFLSVCSPLTQEHPEVLTFLGSRHLRAHPDFRGSAEFRNILGRLLRRVRDRPRKVYVYINELCTVLKARALRRRLALRSAPPAADPCPPSTDHAPSRCSGASSRLAGSDPSRRPEEPRRSGGSRRQIRHLEHLLRVYASEIRRLQERELDLAELDSADSPYLQENRLKRRMMRIFRRLCQLKECSSLTGRVLEQRIRFRGTRYPEVNRRIERFINRPDAFPDYSDILREIRGASARHGLGLGRRQMENMAQEAFREVGNRLQERRHLDLVYNFGSHLTDQYRPGTDPALSDPELAQRLRRNRRLALARLDDVIARFAQRQERSRDTEPARKHRNK
ncbi:PREDICTED: death domain-associated protein 6-like, partial [Sturnus vulgaris]|uniref:death domain-associated protein 6-like n=1 Tax=Sturnus vulgaris TaxID=9172 RepID=UPI00071A85C2